MTDVRQPRACAADSLHAEIYDALAASVIAGSTVEGDIDFYRGPGTETGGPILDVGRTPGPQKCRDMTLD